MTQPTPRRSLDDNYPDGYLESDRDFVLNNIDWCVAKLDQWFEDNTEEAIERRISAFGYRTGLPRTSCGRSW